MVTKGGGPIHFGSKTLDKTFEEAEESGTLVLSGRNLRNLSCSDGYDILDVTEADLTKNRFTEVPIEICSCSSLERLVCHHNVIRSIPAAFGELTTLTYLDISRNQLCYLPASTCLASLETLIVSSNRLDALPSDIGRMTNLIELDAGNNDLRLLPLEMGRLSKLRCLKLRRNLLNDLPDSLSRLKLVHLDVTANHIKMIPRAFSKMSTLSTFLLEQNPLTMPPPEVCSRGLIHVMKYLQRQIEEQNRPQRASSSASRRSRTEWRLGRRPRDSATESPTLLQQRQSVSLTTELERAEENIAQKHGLEAWRRPGSANRQRDERSVTTTATASLSQNQSQPPESPKQKEGFRPYHPTIPPKPDVLRSDGEKRLDHRLAGSGRNKIEQRSSGSKISPPSPRAALIKTARKASDGAIEDKRRLENLKELERQHNKKIQRLAQQDVGKSGKTTPPTVATASPKETRNDVAERRTGSPAGLSAETRDKATELRASPRLTGKRRPASHRGSPTPSSPGGLKYKPSDPGPHRPTIYSKSLPRAKPNFKVEGKTNFTVRRKEINMYEGIQRIEKMREALESHLGVTLPDDLTGSLSDGIALCNFVNRIKPLTITTIYTTSSESKKLTMLKSQKNVDAFLDGCRKLGVPQTCLCSPADILEERDPLKLCMTVETLLLPGDAEI